MASSFLRFLVGFLSLISLSFAITFTVNKYVQAQDAQQQAAAAVAAIGK
ncbi:MAG TPA: hypothetical protein VJH69_01235 [Candidatus Paceibacterota bacterium]